MQSSLAPRIFVVALLLSIGFGVAALLRYADGEVPQASVVSAQDSTPAPGGSNPPDSPPTDTTASLESEVNALTAQVEALRQPDAFDPPAMSLDGGQKDLDRRIASADSLLRQLGVAQPPATATSANQSRIDRMQARLQALQQAPETEDR